MSKSRSNPHHMNYNYLFFFLVLTLNTANAQVDTIYHLDSKQIKKYLKPSSNQYLVFIQQKDNPQKAITSIWSREVRFKKKNNEDIIEIEQKWYVSDSTRSRYLLSQMKADDFSPIYHYVKTIKGIDAFDFYSDKTLGSDSVMDNSKKGWELKHSKPYLNWELDLETFPLLDLKAGKRFFINFYHPGGRLEPKLWEYKVTGEENVKTIEGETVACWKLRIDYDEKSTCTFFISKKGREVLKMEEAFGNRVRYKVRLSNTVPIL